MKNAEVLNDLVEINNDRIKGYEKASKETSDNDLRTLFSEMASQSRQFAAELRACVKSEGEEPAEGTTIRGKIYRTWMDVKATFAGDNRKSVLAACEFGEDAAQRAYNSALEEDDLSADVRSMISKQQVALRKSHDTIKRMRDAQPV